jgi:phosphate transport system permease protein
VAQAETWLEGTGASHRRRSRALDRAFSGTTAVLAFGLALLLFAIIAVTAKGASRVLQEFGVWHFLTGTAWNPVTGREDYGALPFIYGTLVTSALAVVLAVPVSIGLGVLLNEIGREWIRGPLTVFVDLLAAIPSVVYGLWGLFILLPFLNETVDPFLAHTVGRVPVVGALFQDPGPGGNVFAAGVILSIMILPIITAITREVIAVVPRDLREASMAMGATRYEAVRMAVLPYARGGIVGATMLGLGRALGETIAVLLVIGNNPQIKISLFAPGSTIPSWIVSHFREASSVGLTRSALLALALVLVVLAFVMAAASRLLLRRTKELGAPPPSVTVAAEPPILGAP